MGSDPVFVEFVVGQIHGTCDISYRKMFGEYCLYSRGKVVGLVCDNQLFIKPTEAGRAFVGDIEMGAPYKGAKPQFLIQDEIENRDWLSELISLTEQELPLPEKKRKPK
jgi:TfoX/Sxy family transcriptional regulator of competence genes